MDDDGYRQQEEHLQQQWENRMSVYKAISNVTADLSKIGISKSSKNTSQGYAFRGIDAVYGALSPLLSKHGLVILPRVTNRDVIERQNKSGTALFYVTLTVEFDFVAASDGSKHTVITVGEAMDSGDKASNKAMSAAYKYACLQTFCIPTEGDNDADATTHEVAAQPAIDPAILTAIDLCETEPELNALYHQLSEAERKPLIPHFAARKKALRLALVKMATP